MLDSTHIGVSPVTEAYKYLDKLHPGLVEREDLPDNYAPSDTLILIRSGGGRGLHSTMVWGARLSFEVRAETSSEAEQLALMVEAELRNWEKANDYVYLAGTHGVPTWDPDPERRVPAYTWSMEFNFKLRRTLPTHR